MRIFISWSKHRSQELARVLNEWIPTVLQAVSPFMSEEIDKGTLWGTVIAKELHESRFGIVCVTPENMREPWLNFEAGSLANVLDRRMSPLLIGIKKADVPEPLALYNLTDTTHDDVLRLMRTMNQQLESPLEESRLSKAFEMCWPELHSAIERVEKMQPAEPASPLRSMDEKLDELLALVRGQAKLRDFERDLAALFDAGSLEQFPSRRPAALDQLAEREYAIARELARGRTLIEIADQFGVTAQRIRQIAERTAKRLGLSNLTALAEYFNRHAFADEIQMGYVPHDIPDGGQTATK